MYFIPFRLDGPRIPVNAHELSTLCRALERACADTSGAEHIRVHSCRTGVCGMVFCLARDAPEALDRSQEVCARAFADAPGLTGWTVQVGGAATELP